MLRNADGESEILLGNTQLIGIFFLLAVLLGVSFTAGYMLGRGSFTGKKDIAQVPTTTSEAPGTALPTAVVGPPTSSAEPPPAESPAAAPPRAEPQSTPTDNAHTSKSSKKATPVEEEPKPKPVTSSTFEPQPGQTFLQVAAELHDSAVVTARALNDSGITTHIVPVPSTKLYRVLVGPVKDKSDLAATRELLKKKGFLTVLVRPY